MNTETLAKINQWFLDYAQRFVKDGKLHPMKQLKLDHSQRVAKNCRAIAFDLGWNNEQVNLAEAVGILHDTGRFSQFREFGTYRDSDSVNHAQRGWEVLREEKIIAGLDEEKIILDSILLHNVKEVPETTDDNSRPYLDLVRDADKLDIYYVIHDALINDKLEDYPEITWKMSDMKQKPNPAVLKALQNRELISYTGIQSLVDFQLVMLAWLPNLSYAPTCARILERGIIEEMHQLLPADPVIVEALQEFRLLLEDRASSNTSISST